MVITSKVIIIVLLLLHSLKTQKLWFFLDANAELNFAEKEDLKLSFWKSISEE